LISLPNYHVLFGGNCENVWFNQVDIGFVIVILVNHRQWLQYDTILTSKN